MLALPPHDVDERAAVGPEHDEAVVHIENEPVLVSVGGDRRAGYADDGETFEKVGGDFALSVDVQEQHHEGVLPLEYEPRRRRWWHAETLPELSVWGRCGDPRLTGGRQAPSRKAEPSRNACFQ